METTKEVVTPLGYPITYRQTSYLLVATGIILCEPHAFQDHVNVTVVTSTLLLLAAMLLS